MLASIFGLFILRERLKGLMESRGLETKYSLDHNKKEAELG